MTIGVAASSGSTRAVDDDFAAEVLRDLYRYRGKRRWLAWLLWGTLGWFGAHRFYLDRPGTALLMLFTAGGGFIWWLVDAFRIGSMVREYGTEQERREREGLPPIELSFMPPLALGARTNPLHAPPEWAANWYAASPVRRGLRLAGDVLVLALVGVILGSAARQADVWEAIVAVFVLVALTAAGSAAGRYAHVPVVEALLRWSHRLRLFYYYNRPGNSVALLLRPLTAVFVAPFRRRDRAEVRMYLQLGIVLTAGFMLLDFGAEVLGPITRGRVPGLSGLMSLWIGEVVVTFIVIYAFATPIGAIISKYLLTTRTHTLPRVLGAVVLVAVLSGLLR